MKVLMMSILSFGIMLSAISVIQLGASSKALSSAGLFLVQQQGGGAQKYCMAVGNGCPGRGCTSSSTNEDICVLCDAIVHEECSTSGTGDACNLTQATLCTTTAAKGYCSGTSCIPVNPQISQRCGVYGVCH